MLKEMQGLVQEIGSSFEERVAGIASVRKDVAAFRGQADRQRHQRAQQRAYRMSEFQEWLVEVAGSRRTAARERKSQREEALEALRNASAQERAGTRAWMGEMTSTRQDMAHQQREALRNAGAQERAGTRAWMGEVTSTRQDMAHQQREALDRGRAELMRGARTRMQEIATHRMDMAQQLRESLAAAVAQDRAEVQGRLGELGGDRAAAGIEWRQMVLALRLSRAAFAEHGGRATAATNGEGSSAIQGTGFPGEEQEAAIGSTQSNQETSPLLGQMFAYLAEHPDGVRLADLEQRFGLSRSEAIRAMRSLVSGGKASRRNRHYVAV